MAIVIKSAEDMEFMKQAGFQYADNILHAYNNETKKSGVVSSITGEFFPTVPLNGWRARNLAEEVFGKREAGELHLGRAFMTTAAVIQGLPDFDGGNQAIVNSYQGVVIVEVVIYDPGYGVHIRILPMHMPRTASVR